MVWRAHRNRLRSWTGIGAVGTVVVGILVFKDPVMFWRLFFLSTLVISLIGLKLVAEWIMEQAIDKNERGDFRVDLSVN
jgi:hypothetical protein